MADRKPVRRTVVHYCHIQKRDGAWRAFCDSCVPIWPGPKRESRLEAEMDAAAHKAEMGDYVIPRDTEASDG